MTKIVREVAATNGTETDVAKMETIDVKKISDPSERLVAIVYPDTWPAVPRTRRRVSW